MEDLSSTLKYNIPLSSIDLTKINARANSVKACEKFRRELPGKDVHWSEVNCPGFTLRIPRVYPMRTKFIATYREHPQEGMKVKGVVLVFHGLGTYMKRIAHIGKALSENGFIAVGFDQPGNGNSNGLFGYTENDEVLIRIIERFKVWVDENYDLSLPRFILGESMGGLLTIDTSLRFKNYFKGMVLLAPAIRISTRFKKIHQFIVSMATKIFSKIPLPFFTMEVVDDCRNPENLEDVKRDELVYKGGVRPASISNLIKIRERVYPNIHNVNTPFLIIQGGHDKYVDPHGAFELIQKSCTDDKNLIFVEEMWHDVAHEPEIYCLLPKITQWLNKRV